MKSSLKRPALFLSLLIGLPIASCAAIRDLSTSQQQPSQQQPNISPSQPQPTPSQQVVATTASRYDLSAVTPVVEQVGPAVVRINSTRTVRESVDRFGIDQFLGRQRSPREEVQRGTGSGFITSADGQIITNAHVVEGADTVTVVLKDGRRFPGKVLGADPLSDIAVVRIEATDLPTVRLGNSDQLVPGQLAIAIGNPLGLSNTVTQGIISATDRSTSDIGIPDKRINFIQTDAAINPGNSGGPLLNGAGEVVGVNTAIIQGAQGLGFAIPINTVQKVAQQLATTGRVEYPYIGVQMTELSPELQSQINQSNLGFQVTQTEGVVVLKVLPNSPAAQAQLRPGDVITNINGTAIETAGQIQQQVDATGINKPMRVTVNRNGQTQELTIRPEALPEQNLAQRGG
ncbi:MAG: trypsin-like peptidase domain-containing protein [Myxacorys californica WJT36-NPBG1]|jgi:S1-C subfamily serine protease|nr:trypsin-like peptidase domain-containing protein [Myxacorys californica WJT36-NPBG1]